MILTETDLVAIGLTVIVAVVVALIIYDYTLVPRLDPAADRLVKWRDRHGSTEVEDATDLDEDEPCTCHVDGHECGGWLPPERDVVLGEDGEMHPIDEQAEEVRADATA